MPQVIKEETLLGDKVHEWSFKEYERHDRGQLWYILMISLGLLMVVYAMWAGNFLFALVIILAGIILFLQAHQEAPEVIFQITDLGVVVGNRFYPYSDLYNFYIIYNPPEVKTLFVETRSPIRPLLRIPLLDVNPLDVRETLLQFLEEDIEREEEPISDVVARQWKLH